MLNDAALACNAANFTYVQLIALSTRTESAASVGAAGQAADESNANEEDALNDAE